jgi:hypothetical protein
MSLQLEAGVLPQFLKYMEQFRGVAGKTPPS